LRNKLHDNIKIAINLSVSELEDIHYAEKILEICQTYYLSLASFEFEITGCSAIHDKKRVMEFCNMLSAVGAEFSLEDFGTALTPLEYLCLLPVSMIKLDSGFINAIGVCPRSEILLNKLIELAHDMNLKIVAEGIEQAYQRDLLIKMHCDQLQGHLMHSPVAIDHLNNNALSLQH
jgi:EAL domain-containing protein (putative c-di-GMP-specific phosphodiesterase class I)